MCDIAEEEFLELLAWRAALASAEPPAPETSRPKATPELRRAPARVDVAAAPT